MLSNLTFFVDVVSYVMGPQRMVEDSSDRTRRLDADSHLQSMEKLKQIEQKAVEDWMVKQQREINSTLKSQAEELKAVEQEVTDEYEQWLERQGTKVSNYALCCFVM